MTVIGILGLQGAVEEHAKQLQTLGLEAEVIKKTEQLEEIDGLILPGGESTTMRKLTEQYGFLEPIREFSAKKKPIFGTCAGMILMAKELSGVEEAHLQIMDVRVKRNAFGRQRDSFEAELDIVGIDTPYSAVFIRAPFIESAGEHVEVLAKYDGKIVAAREGHILTCAFHPELTDDTSFLQIFVKMVEKHKQRLKYSLVEEGRQSP
ncbi:pyridoxal 5'-phosphate synthase glutaminase subunit PdxT [Bacillus dakarensis]|uniref:pyridoxal 5'-phosphate synthase glutaminase subunit PdxT n=1 Tax=Robertmurraya dakarensis TaxID=1926278 RepID=UPI0009826990|nr:pyridoxal 5'-phosphate synthase glutaminase subunit PdxT [Bacillus dakarensis]